MRTQIKLLFGNTRLTKISIMMFLFSALLVQGTAFASVQKQGEITRGEFIKMLAQNHADNSLLPKNHSQLSSEPLFSKVAQALKSRGINVLENKSADDLLSQQEFVRITYTFAGGPKNKSLFEQKLFLKNASIISSTDIGITTGMDGKVF